MERSPEFYEHVWAAAYAAACAAGKGTERAVYEANNAVDDLRDEERTGTCGIARREELFRTIRVESAK